MKKTTLILWAFCSFLTPSVMQGLMAQNALIFGQIITSSQIDSLVEKVLITFDVPGISVAVVKDDKVIHSKGYGVRSLDTKQKVDENTLFGIASNSKAFTTAA